MADINYTVNQELPENIEGFEQYSQEDKNLINSFQINSSFDPEKNFAELHILSLSDELLESDYLYNRQRQLGNAQSAGQDGASVLTIDPIADSKFYGYEGGGVKLLYHFLDDLYTDDITTREFFIQNISPDRTEVVLNSLNITEDEVLNYTSAIKNKLDNQSYFTGFRLNFKENDLIIATNIDTIDSGTEKLIAVKLYEPLPDTYDLKSTLTVVEIISDSIAYEVDSEYVLEPEQLPTLRSANFNIEIADQSVIPTAYLNYNELFSYPVTNVNNQVYSAISEKGIDINVDYADFTSFVHFSSAEERLLNFKYKVDLLSSYFANISSSQGATTGLQGVSGSRAYYENLITGVINNFDHYERFLYYESGSSSWPKSNITKPYTNKISTTSEAITWFTAQRSQAIYYDQTNYNSLVNSIPTYLRDDSNNDNYTTFVYMIGQHFDNLWLYAKAVTDKYDADNRLDKGISKDLVGEALTNFGVKLYTSNKSIENLFSTFTGQAYQSGSEKINNYITGSLTGSNASIQPSSFDNYQKEIQKRIYHNLPLLLKSKGTERGLRALINCFGIPGDILDIKLYGGRNTDILPFFANSQYSTSSLSKIRLDNTGSLVSGSTLSNYTSIIKRDNKYTDDLHTIEVGFSPTDNIDTYIVSKSAATFNIDDYLGDPQNLYLDNYSGLYGKADTLLSGSLGTSSSYDLQDYVRLIKFFDNTIFKTIKDFIPARSNADVGVIIKPNILNISKAKSVAVSATQPEYTASINTAFFEGSTGGAFTSATILGGHYNTSWIDLIQTPHGIGEDRRNASGSRLPEYTGELSGSILYISNGELNSNNEYKQPTILFYNANSLAIQTLLPNFCGILPKGPFTVTTTPYNIVSSLQIPGNSSVIYTIESGSETPVDITTTANSYTFPKNYTTYIVTASKSPIVPGCSGSYLYNTEFCDMSVLTNIPKSIEGGRQVDITRWFATASNASSSYTASYSNLGGSYGIADPNNFYPNSESTYVTASITLQDSKIAACNRNIQVVLYPTMSVVEIGVQDWALKNLEVDTYTDGTSIPQITDPTQWASLTTGAWCYYGNNITSGSVYGKLYNWYAVAGIFDEASTNNTALRKQLYPSDWKAPSDTEWNTIVAFLGGNNVAGGKMKATGTSLWNSPNTGATNSSGFTGVPGGYRNYTNNNSFEFTRTNNFLWSLSEYNNTQARYRDLRYHSAFISTDFYINKIAGLSIRLTRPVTRVLIGANQTSANTGNASQMFTLYNLDTTRYRNGDLIPQASSSTQFNSYGDSGIGSWCYYNFDPANNATYGKLYNWYAVNDSRNIAPVNYYVPSNTEWTTLTTYLGGVSVAGGKMKETGSVNWLFSPSSGSTNSSGFTALPGGIHTYNEGFSQIGFLGAWWASDQQDSANAHSRYIAYNSPTINSGGSEKDSGLSVRLIKSASVWRTN